MKEIKGWRFDFRGPNLFWQRGVDCIMSSPNADLIAVSLVYSKDPKSSYIEYGAPWVSSVRTLLEKVGRLETLQFWSIQTSIFGIHRSVLNLVKLSRIIILYFLKGFAVKIFIICIIFISWIHILIRYYISYVSI